MTVTVLSIGTLVSEPQVRTSSTTRQRFTAARMAAGTGEENVLVSLIAFGSAGQQLAALTKGDSLAVSGRAKPTTWRDREGAHRAGLDVFVDGVMSLHELKRRRKALAPDQEPPPDSLSGGQTEPIDNRGEAAQPGAKKHDDHHHPHRRGLGPDGPELADRRRP